MDHLGTPRLITGPNGEQVSIHDYLPFGTEITPLRQESGPTGLDREEPVKFTSHERDFNGGVYAQNTNYFDYMHARYHDPNWGRFLSTDPVLGDPLRPQSWNRYTYVLNNPVTLTDPTGMVDSGRIITCSDFSGGIPCVSESITVGAKDPRTPPQGQSWRDNARYLTEWALGQAPQNRVFGQTSLRTQEMMSSPSVDIARALFYKKNAANIASGKPPSATVTGARGTFGPFGRDGILRAGTNATRQFVGSYDIDVTPTPNGMVRFTLTNVTSVQSLLYGIGPEWSQHPFDNSFTLPGGNVTQTYTWAEPLR